MEGQRNTKITEYQIRICGILHCDFPAKLVFYQSIGFHQLKVLNCPFPFCFCVIIGYYNLISVQFHTSSGIRRIGKGFTPVLLPCLLCFEHQIPQPLMGCRILFRIISDIHNIIGIILIPYDFQGRNFSVFPCFHIKIFISQMIPCFRLFCHCLPCCCPNFLKAAHIRENAAGCQHRCQSGCQQRHGFSSFPHSFSSH